jgi:putative transposase
LTRFAVAGLCEAGPTGVCDPGYSRIIPIPEIPMPQSDKHLTRLGDVWVPAPIYFVTVCTEGRARRLHTTTFHAIAVEVWRNCERLYGWFVGRYVLMPDHVHFFVTDGRGENGLSLNVGKWKEWTAKYAARRHGETMPLWQGEFFDQVMRSGESYSQKWEYVRNNPVRAGLVTQADDWPYQGALNELRFD